MDPKYGGPMRGCTWQHYKLHKARVNSGTKKMLRVDELEQQYDHAWQIEEENKSERVAHEGEKKVLPGAGWDEEIDEVANGAGWSEDYGEAPSTFQFKLESALQYNFVDSTAFHRYTATRGSLGQYTGGIT